MFFVILTRSRYKRVKIDEDVMSSKIADTFVVEEKRVRESMREKERDGRRSRANFTPLGPREESLPFWDKSESRYSHIIAGVRAPLVVTHTRTPEPVSMGAREFATGNRDRITRG